MRFVEWFFSLFLNKKAKAEKHKAYLDMTKANKRYLDAKNKNDRYLRKYSGRKKYQKA